MKYRGGSRIVGSNDTLCRSYPSDCVMQNWMIVVHLISSLAPAGCVHAAKPHLSQGRLLEQSLLPVSYPTHVILASHDIPAVASW